MDRFQLINDPEVGLRYSAKGNQAQMWTALPAIVESVDLIRMTISAQPSIQGVITNPDGSETNVNLPLLVDVPIVFPSAGGFSFTFPITVNDEVLIVFSSRCIDAWWQSGGIGVPMEARMHDLSDGFAIPGPKSQPNVIGGISSSNAQLRNNAGTVFLEITPSGHINATAPAGMTFTTPTLTVTGDVIANGTHLHTHTHSGVATGPFDTGPPV